VVAKRCPRAVGALEHRVYTELLPELHVSTPRCHGWLGEGESSWLFVEDAGTMRFDGGDAAHRACALDWLARLHSMSMRLVPPAQLPDRGVARHLALLREARQLIHRSQGNPVLSEQDHEALRAVLATCDLAEANWGRFEAVCAAMPVAYVHGDFRPKNLFLRADGAELTLLPIDWEYSGWSIPALDLGSLLLEHGEPAELSSYRAALEPLVPGLGEAELWTWVCAGRAMRAVSSIHWTRNALSHPYVEKPLNDLHLYCGALERAFEALAFAAG
jgi:aminoglycoside phosphotransferase (APT) family kinase protein